MLDGQPFTQVIAPAGAALFLVQDGRGGFTAQLLQLVMQQVVFIVRLRVLQPVLKMLMP